MPLPRFFRHLPSPETIRNNRLLKPFRRHLQHHFLWQLNRRSVAGGAAVGLFFGILIPFGQILFATLSAITLRVNLPVAVAATLISNPLTFGPIYYLAYRLGKLLYPGPGNGADTSAGGGEEERLAAEVDTIMARQAQVEGWLPNLMEWVRGAGPTISIGLLLMASAAAVLGYLVVSGLWRARAARRWRRRPGYQPFRLRTWEARAAIPRQLALAIGFVGFILVATLDAITSAQVSLLLLHLLPVLFVTWFAGPRWGIVIVILMVTVQSLVYLRSGVRMDSYWYMDMASDYLAILLLVGLQTRLRRTHDELLRLAKHDPLTHSLNRNGFYAALGREIERHKRSGEPFSLTYFDCDNFKQVNDRFGHHSGDRVLIEVGRTLRACTRKIDAVGRLGGDEFALLFPATDLAAARKKVGVLKHKLDETMQREGWPVTFSIGVVAFAQPPATVDAALERADCLMYQAKREGKDDIVYAT